MSEEADMSGPGQEAPEDVPDTNAKPWLDAIKEAEKYFYEYNEKCDKIDDLYANLKKLSNGNAERQMQIFWANLEVLKPSIYARPPVPVVAARFKDRKPMVRHAGEILERTIASSFDQEDINETMIGLRDDLAISARGVAWIRLEDEEGEPQAVCYDHVDRKDFLHDPARKWKEVSWVARRTHQTMEEMRERFEATSENEFIHAVYAERKKDGEDYSGDKKACVWEIWHKSKKVVVWVAEGCKNVLDMREPFLDIHGFFPCPRPAYGTVERGTLKPVPDFVYYKDQVEEINELTARISALSESLKMKGFYAGGNEDVAGAIESAMKQTDNNAILIPVPNFAAMGGAGLRDSIIWLPVRDIAEVIMQLISLRKQLIEDVYQITGISDIMRGNTDANETLGAQQLKSQYGSVRVRDRQGELVRIARDITRIAGEIMAENFSAETLMQMSLYDGVPTNEQLQQKMMQAQQQIQQIKMQVQQAMSDPQMMAQAEANPEQAQQLLQQAQQQVEQGMQALQAMQSEITFEQVLEFIKSEKTRPFALEIETDSTIQPDDNAAKEQATEFLGALATALAQLTPMVASQPQSADFAAEVLKFAVAPFRAGRSLEGAIERFADQVKQVAAQPKEDPRAIAAKAEAEAMQAEMQQKQQQAEIEAGQKAQEFEARQALTKQQSDELARKSEFDMQIKEIELEKAKVDLLIKKADLATRDVVDDGEDGVRSRTDDNFRMLGEGMMASRQDLNTMMASIAQMLDQHAQRHSESLDQMKMIASAPNEIVKGPDGRPIGTRKLLQ